MKDPSSPAYGMTDKTISALCLCNCETIARDMPPKLRDTLMQVQKSGARPSPDLVKQYSEVAMKAMEVCVPKFQKPAKK